MLRRLAFLLVAASGGVHAQDAGVAARTLVAQAYDAVLDGTAYRFSFRVETTTPDTFLVDVGDAVTALDPETAAPRFSVAFADGEVQQATLDDAAYAVSMPRTRTVYVDSSRTAMTSGPVGLLMMHPAFGAGLYSLAGDARAEVVGRDSVDGAACTRARYALTLDAEGNELALDVCFDDAVGLPIEIRYSDSGGVSAQMTFADYRAAGAAAEFQPTLTTPDGWRTAPYDSSTLPTLAVGDAAPGFQLLTPGGDAVALSDFRGQTLLVDFWGTWCAPCAAAVPKVQTLAEAYPDLAVIGLAAYEDEAADPVGFVRERGGRYPILLADQATIDAWRVHAFPTYVVIDPDGVVVFVAVDDREPDALAGLSDFLSTHFAD